MNHKQVSIRCLLLSSESACVLIPAANVAEIITFVPPKVTPGAPDWFLGEITWREQVIPVVCLNAKNEIISENPGARKPRAKTVILYGLRQETLLPFYGIRVMQVPRPLFITPTDLVMAGTLDPATSLSLALVKVGDADASIPNFTLLEHKIREVLRSEAVIGKSRVPIGF